MWGVVDVGGVVVKDSEGGGDGGSGDGSRQVCKNNVDENGRDRVEIIFNQLIPYI